MASMTTSLRLRRGKREMQPTTRVCSPAPHAARSSVLLRGSGLTASTSTRLGTTSTFSAGTPASMIVRLVPSGMAMIRRARRAASAYRRRAGPRRIGGGTGPHSAHTISPVSLRGNSAQRSCSFLKCNISAPTGRCALRARARRSSVSGACATTSRTVRRASFGPRSIARTGTPAPAARSGKLVSSTTSCPRALSAASRSTLAYSAPPRSFVVWIETIRPWRTRWPYYPAGVQGAPVSLPDRPGRAGASPAGDWILEIDADERASEEVRASIEGLLAAEASDVEMAVCPLRNHFLGRPLGPSAKYPGYRARMFRRGAYRHDEARMVHEGIEPRRRPFVLGGDLEHELAGTL